MSRPKGSKNKPKVTDVIQPDNAAVVMPPDLVASCPAYTQSVQPNAVVINKPVDIVEVKQKSRKKECLVAHPDWVLTSTIYGTPIAIIKILKNSKCCDLVVIPHYETKTYQTTISSISVIKPEFTTEEIAKLYEGIKFYTPPITLNDIPVVSETVVESPNTITVSPNIVTVSPDTTTLKDTTLNAGV